MTDAQTRLVFARLNDLDIEIKRLAEIIKDPHGQLFSTTLSKALDNIELLRVELFNLRQEVQRLSKPPSSHDNWSHI